MCKGVRVVVKVVVEEQEDDQVQGLSCVAPNEVWRGRVRERGGEGHKRERARESARHKQTHPP